jgi:lysosomal Pro-X carboxypeptidase
LEEQAAATLANSVPRLRSSTTTASSLAAITCVAENLTYTTRFYNNTLDHLAPFSPDVPTFSHRYLVSDDYFGHQELLRGLSEDCPGPILMYAGNEGAVTGFWDGNGFMKYLAVKYGGMLLFPEERYYGKSIPQKQTHEEGRIYLTTQQVLEDYVELLAHVKKEYNAESCPTIVFGGSYGGTLAALLRSAYPFAIHGALASSSELGYYDVDGWEERGITEYTFAEIVARQYNKTEGCLEAVWDASDLIDSMGIDPTNRTRIMTTFNFCDDSALSQSPSSIFIYGLEGLPQQNYPYAIGNRPAWPVQAVCEIMTSKDSSDSLLERAAQATALSMGYTLNGECLATPVEGPGNVPGDGPGRGSWGYQSCTETLHTFSSVVRDPMRLGLRNYDFQQERPKLNQLCQELYHVVPNTHCLKDRYGGFDIAKTTSNTIFSAGQLDPWGGAALTARDGGADAAIRNVHFFSMANGAHHLDLRGWNDADPLDVTEVRQMEEEIIAGWIRNWMSGQKDEG